MSRQIKITKYEGNTHYNVHVVDSFGQEHHLGYLDMNLTIEDVDRLSKEIWSNEIKREVDPLSFTIHKLHQHDVERGILTGNRDGLD